ncbi:carboxymuconolactone decarboxylase family protein [Caulobacter sp. LARHSG274]
MATTPRIPEQYAKGFTMLAGDQDSPAARIAIPQELNRLAGIPIASARSLQLDPVLHECVRLFNANYQGCEYCRNARQAVAVQAGLDEDMVSKLTRFESSDLPERTKAALRITDALASAPQMLTDAIWNGARQHFSEQEVVDLVLLSCYTTGSRVAIILGVEPGKEASSRLFYPTDPVYGDSPDLSAAIEALKEGGVAVKERGEGYDRIPVA